MVRRAFNGKYTLLTTKNTQLKSREKFPRAFIMPAALHGPGTWTENKVDEKGIEDFEIWPIGKLRKLAGMRKTANIGKYNGTKSLL